VAALASSVKWVWALSVLLQLALFALLFFKGSFRRLPILTTYIALNLCQAAYLLYLYSGAGSNLRSLAWGSEAVTLIFQALAATEAIRLALKPYPGIWGLGWRAIGFIAAMLLTYIAKHTAGNYSWALLELDRGYHLLFATAIISCFVLIRYYAIRVPVAYKLLLGGFCFYSCIVILTNTVLQSLLYGNFAAYEPIWQFASILAFALVQLVWTAALRRPLPVDDRLRALASDDIYQQVSPIIDSRLRLLNEKLLRIWKTEARSQ